MDTRTKSMLKLLEMALPTRREMPLRLRKLLKKKQLTIKISMFSTSTSMRKALSHIMMREDTQLPLLLKRKRKRSQRLRLKRKSN